MPIPAYTNEDLASRVADGSVDLSRLAATVADLQVSVTAMANWVNGQIQAQAAQQSADLADAESQVAHAHAQARSRKGG